MKTIKFTNQEVTNSKFDRNIDYFADDQDTEVDDHFAHDQDTEESDHSMSNIDYFADDRDTDPSQHYSTVS